MDKNMDMERYLKINDINVSDFNEIEKTSENMFFMNDNNIEKILESKDKKIEIVFFNNSQALAKINSSLFGSVYYPFYKSKPGKDIKYVLMDLDGTSIKSENFWIEIIRKTIAELLGKTDFYFEEADIPNVSGHSVSEHLIYCINKYSSDSKLEDAKLIYNRIVADSLNNLEDNEENLKLFMPNDGLKQFLLRLKEKGIKIALVTSGSIEKSMRSLEFVFKQMDLGNPKDFYDCIITSGTRPQKGEIGTLGEIEAKPHPWLYSEAVYVGLGLTKEDLKHTIAIEDSSAGIYSIKLSGITAVGISGGNIEKSGTLSICDYYCNDLKEIYSKFWGEV